MQARVDFSRPAALTSAGVALVIGIADYTWSPGDLVFGGIALGTAASLVIYHVMTAVGRWRGTDVEPASPASLPPAEPRG